MSAQTKQSMAFELGSGALDSIRRSTTEPVTMKETEDTPQIKQAKAKPASQKRAAKPKETEEEMVRFQVFLPKSLKRRIKLYAASEDTAMMKAVADLLSEALSTKGA
ncbi:MAG: hypothetical protein HFJ65_08600 [Eggerthellaceae bacterium]|nr:hypothetical protein [Eggerthellaceae bacterium]